MKNVLLALVGMICALTAAGRSVIAGVEGDAELLRLVAIGYKANRERILTWKGSASLTLTGNFQDPEEMLRRTGEVQFVMDREREARRWNYQYMTSSGTKDGVVRAAEPDSDYQETMNAMFKDDAFYRYHYHTPKTYTGARVLIITSSQEANVIDQSDDFDPLYWSNNRGRDVYEELMTYYSDRDNPDLDFVLRRDGNIVTIETKGSRGDGYVKYDIAKGCNVVELLATLTSKGGRDTWKYSWEWENADGVFVPARFVGRHDTHYEGDDARHAFTQREIVFKDMAVNQPLADSEFNLQALGIRPGDRIQNNITGMLYEYGVSEINEATLRSAELDDVVDSLDDIAPDDVAIEETEAVVETTPQPEAATDEAAAPRESDGRGGAFWGKWVVLVGGLAVLAAAVVFVRKRAAGARR